MIAKSIVCVALALLFGCGTSARCGDGKVDPGETEALCCADVGCQRGVCNGAAGCVDPATLSCPATVAGCSPDQPYLCGGAVPAYDCAMCGCPANQVCDHAVCQPSDLAALQRDSLRFPLDLDIEAYFPFYDDGMAAAMSFPELVDTVDQSLRRDPRYAAIVLGESHNSDDEQTVGRELVRALYAKHWTFGRMGIEGGMTPIFDGSTLADSGIQPFAITGDLTNAAYCAAVKREAGMLLNTDHLYVQYTGSGHTSREACYHPELYTVCKSPHIAECLRPTGRLPITVMLFDPDIWMTPTDTALLWRAGNLLPDTAAFDTALNATLAAWQTHIGKQLADPKFDVVLDGKMVNVRIRKATHDDDTYIAFFPRPGREPFLAKTWKAVWDDLAGKQFLITNALRPQDCSISWDHTAAKNSVHCDKGGPTLDATVDGNTFVVISLTTT